jgi:hypothetical protein
LLSQLANLAKLSVSVPIIPSLRAKRESFWGSLVVFEANGPTVKRRMTDVQEFLPSMHSTNDEESWWWGIRTRTNVNRSFCVGSRRRRLDVRIIGSSIWSWERDCEQEHNKMIDDQDAAGPSRCQRRLEERQSRINNQIKERKCEEVIIE